MKIEHLYDLDLIQSSVDKVADAYNKSKVFQPEGVYVNNAARRASSYEVRGAFFDFLQIAIKRTCLENDVDVAKRVADFLVVAFAACGANEIECFYDQNEGLIVNPSDEDKQSLTIKFAPRLYIGGGQFLVEDRI